MAAATVLSSLFLALLLSTAAGFDFVSTDEPDDGGTFDQEAMDGAGLSVREIVGLNNRGVIVGEVVLNNSLYIVPASGELVFEWNPALGPIRVTAPIAFLNELTTVGGGPATVVFDGRGETSLFEIAFPPPSRGEVWFSEIVFRNAFSEGGGSAMHISGDAGVSVGGGSFEGCSAGASGGAIYVEGSRAGLMLSASQDTGEWVSFEECSAGGDGGAIAVAGVEGASPTFDHQISADFSACSATGDGGGVYLSYTSARVFGTASACSGMSGGFLAARHSTIYTQMLEATGCTATHDGGAVMYEDSAIGDSSALVWTISGCTAGGNGGGVSLRGMNATPGFGYSVLSLTNNEAGGDGGGLFAGDASLPTVNAATWTLRGNVAKGLRGGGGALVAGGNDFRFLGFIAEDNIAENGSGGALNLTGDRWLDIADLACERNMAAASGGGLFLKGLREVHLVEGQNHFRGNTASEGKGGALAAMDGVRVFEFSGDARGNRAGGAGGAIYCEADAVLLEGGEFQGNSSAGGRGGAVAAITPRSGGSLPSRVVGRYEDNHVTGSEGRGGGLFFEGRRVYIEGSFEANSASGDGGGLYVDAGQCETSSLNVVGNAAGPSHPSEAGRGGGFFLMSADFSILGLVSVSRNRASFQGGGMWCESHSPVPIYITNDGGLEDGLFSYNRCIGEAQEAGGGGAYLKGVRSSFNTIRRVFFRNHSAGDGGGCYLDGAATTIQGRVVLSENSAERYGGGLYSNYATWVSDMEFIRNAAKLGGGGISIAHHADPPRRTGVDGCSFRENSTMGSGGGVHVVGRAISLSSDFTANSAAVDGGGAWLDGTSVAIGVYSTFGGNRAERDGGALWLRSSGTSTLDGTAFDGCSAGGRGGALAASGGIYLQTCSFRDCSASTGGGLYSAGKPVVVWYSGFSGCSASGQGGAVAIGGTAFARFVYSSLSRNAAEFGGGIWSDAGTLVFSNSSVVKNSATTNGGGMGSLSGSLSLDESTVAGNTAGVSGGGISAGESVVDSVFSIVAQNTAPAGPDVGGEMNSGGAPGIVGSPSGVSGNTYGILFVDPLFYRFEEEFFTITEPSTGRSFEIPAAHYVPHAASPAVNAGSIETPNVVHDQRWFSQRGAKRLVGERRDLGAIELQHLPRPYSEWADQRIDDVMRRAPSDDADADGIANSLERLFGYDPSVPEQSPIAVSREGGRWILSYPLGWVEAGEDAFFWSEDLSVWNAGLPEGALRSVVLPEGDPMPRVTIEVPAGADRMYSRVGTTVVER